MSKGNFPIHPIAARPGCGLGSNGMTYRQHLVAQIAPVMLTNFFSNDAWTDYDDNDAWTDYDDFARTLVMAVDAIIEAEQETAR